LTSWRKRSAGIASCDCRQCELPTE